MGGKLNNTVTATGEALLLTVV